MLIPTRNPNRSLYINGKILSSLALVTIVFGMFVIPFRFNLNKSIADPIIKKTCKDYIYKEDAQVEFNQAMDSKNPTQIKSLIGLDSPRDDDNNDGNYQGKGEKVCELNPSNLWQR